MASGKKLLGVAAAAGVLAAGAAAGIYQQGKMLDAQLPGTVEQINAQLAPYGLVMQVRTLSRSFAGRDYAVDILAADAGGTSLPALTWRGKAAIFWGVKATFSLDTTTALPSAWARNGLKGLSDALTLSISPTGAFKRLSWEVAPLHYEKGGERFESGRLTVTVSDNGRTSGYTLDKLVAADAYNTLTMTGARVSTTGTGLMTMKGTMHIADLRLDGAMPCRGRDLTGTARFDEQTADGKKTVRFDYDLAGRDVSIPSLLTSDSLKAHLSVENLPAVWFTPEGAQLMGGPLAGVMLEKAFMDDGLKVTLAPLTVTKDAHEASARLALAYGVGARGKPSYGTLDVSVDPRALGDTALAADIVKLLGQNGVTPDNGVYKAVFDVNDSGLIKQ